jgi:hypothetical protein
MAYRRRFGSLGHAFELIHYQTKQDGKRGATARRIRTRLETQLLRKALSSYGKSVRVMREQPGGVVFCVLLMALQSRFSYARSLPLFTAMLVGSYG